MSTSQAFIFHRPELAVQLADALVGQGPFTYRSGLFLAAPRRTGKSTFLRHDLVPELQRRGLLTLYVDLWSDRQRDPATLLFDAIKHALHENEHSFVKGLKKTGLSKIGLGPFVSFEIDKLGTPQGATLTEALSSLAQKTGKSIGLVVDEAQHALSSEAGTQSMFALKAARDAMNQTTGANKLTLVFTGSHRDKLSKLLLRRDQAFFGAHLIDFPMLGRDYCNAYTQWLNERLADDNQFYPQDVFAAFEILGYRPELLEKVLSEFALGQNKSLGLKQSLAEGAKSLREEFWEEFDRDFSQLTPLQKVILQFIIDKNESFTPFSQETLLALSSATAASVDTSQIQAAIDGLRQKNIVWRSARATYALEDQAMAEWYLARHGKSPP